MSSRRLLLLAPLLAFALVMPVPAAASSRVDLVGTLQLVHGEDFDTGAAIYDYHLQTGNERVQLKFASAAPDGFENGATVRVKGRRDGGTIVADGATATGTQVLMSAPGFSGPRKLAVILLNFTNNTTKPFTRAFANGVVFSNANSVRAYFAEQSHGGMVLQGTTFDWVRVPYSNSSCLFGEWAQAAKASLALHGYDLSTYTNFMYVFPQSNACGWSGLGYLPGSETWINGTPNLRTSAHELAHNFGVHHASTLRCTLNGVRVALSRTCTTNEYGDPFSTMGAAGTRHDTNLALAQMGYLPSSATRTLTTSGSYSLVYSSATWGTRVLRIARPNGTWFYLEYRRPYGTYFDNYSTTSAAVKGVMIRIAKDWTAITETLLIDTVPSTTTFADAPLRLNYSFTDFLSGVKIKVAALTGSTATVTVTFPADKTAPTAPGAVTAKVTAPIAITLGWTAGTDNRAVTGYRIWRNSVLVKTTAATALTYSDTGLATSTTYAYTIRTVDGAGNLSPAVTVSATTPFVDTTAPTAPVATITAANGQWANLRWSAASDNVGVASYRVYRDGTLLATAAAGTLTLHVQVQGTYTVVAVDAAGNASAASAPVTA